MDTHLDWVHESAFGKWFLNTRTWVNRVLQIALNDLVNHMDDPNKPFPVILDVGVGFGKSLRGLDHQFHPEKIIGLDVDSAIIEEAREHARQCNAKVEFLISNAARIKLPDSSVDMVFCHQTFHHIVDQESAIKEFYRVLKPGGTVIIATPDRSARLFPFQKPWNAFHVYEYSDKELAELILRFFKNVRMLKMGGDWELFGIEQKRVRKMKWLSLPFTLPMIPETVRQNVLKYIMSVKRKRQTSKPGVTADWSFDTNDIRIEESVPESVNLIAVANK